MGPRDYEALRRIVDLALLVIEAVLGGQNVVAVQDTSSAGVVTGSEIHLAVAQLETDLVHSRSEIKSEMLLTPAL